MTREEKLAFAWLPFRFTVAAVCDRRGSIQNPKNGGRRPPLQNQAIAKIEAVAAAGREVRRIRAEALQTIKGGLRALYRTLELPGANPLKDAHAALDTAVLTAYGFDAKNDLLAPLLALQQEIAQRIKSGQPVTAPEVPKGHPKAKELVTEDCIQPNRIQL